MKRPTISIIVPVYNVEEYLNRCLNSIESQTFSDFECVLVDDGSTDSSGQLCDEWEKKDERFVCFHKANGGLSDARNAGISKSNGKYVTFVDSDDWIYADYLEVLYQGIEEFGADIVSSQLIRFSNEFESDNHKRSKLIWNTYTQNEYLEYYFRIKGNKSVHYVCGKLFSRELLTEDQFPFGMLNEDVEGFYRALLNAKRIAETKRETYCYYYNPNSITGQGFGTNYLCLCDVWKRIAQITEKTRPELLWAAEYNIKRADFTILCDSIVHGSRESDRLFQEELEDCRTRLNSNLKALLHGPMRLDRKISLVIIAKLYKVIVSIKRDL